MSTCNQQKLLCDFFPSFKSRDTSVLSVTAEPDGVAPGCRQRQQWVVRKWKYTWSSHSGHAYRISRL